MHPTGCGRHKEMVDWFATCARKGRLWLRSATAGGCWFRRACCGEGRRPAFFAIKDDLVNAGALYEDREVVSGCNLVTSRKPEDLPAFCRTIIAALSGQKHNPSWSRDSTTCRSPLSEEDRGARENCRHERSLLISPLPPEQLGEAAKSTPFSGFSALQLLGKFLTRRFISCAERLPVALQVPGVPERVKDAAGPVARTCPPGGRFTEAPASTALRNVSSTSRT